MRVGHVHQQRRLVRIVDQRGALIGQGVLHVAMRNFKRCRRVMTHRGIEVGLLRSPARVAFELGDIRAVYRSVMNHSALDRVTISTADWLCRRRCNRQVRGICARPASHRHPATLFNMINDGLWQAQFARGGQIFYLVTFFDSAERADAPAVFQDNRIRRCPAAHAKERGTQQHGANSAS